MSCLDTGALLSQLTWTAAVNERSNSRVVASVGRGIGYPALDEDALLPRQEDADSQRGSVEVDGDTSTPHGGRAEAHMTKPRRF